MIESLLILPTEETLGINFNPKENQFIISGKSRPENSGKFFGTVFTWLEIFCEKLKTEKANSANTFVFVFKMEYFNSVSAKYIVDILFMLKECADAGNNIVIEWHYHKMDDDMLDSGTEFADMTGLNFNLIADE